MKRTAKAAARAYLKVIAREPEMVRKALRPRRPNIPGRAA
jgi:hypothetical protein